MVCIASLLVYAQVTAAPARMQAWNPDPTLSFELPKTQRFARSGAKVEGALELFQDRDHPASMILVSFRAHAKLSKHVESGHEELLRLVPNKRVEPMDSKVLNGIFSVSGLKFAAFAYPSKPKVGTAGSVCDAAAVHWETAGGVWTVSANGNLGDAKTIQSVLESFLKSSRLQDLNRPAALSQNVRVSR